MENAFVNYIFRNIEISILLSSFSPLFLYFYQCLATVSTGLDFYFRPPRITINLPVKIAIDIAALKIRRSQHFVVW